MGHVTAFQIIAPVEEIGGLCSRLLEIKAQGCFKVIVDV